MPTVVAAVTAIIRALWPPHAGRRVRTDNRVRPYLVAIPYTPAAAPVIRPEVSPVRPYVIRVLEQQRAEDQRYAVALLSSLATDG